MTVEQRVSYDGTTCSVAGCNQGGHHWPDKKRFPPNGHGVCPPYWLRPDACPNKAEHYANKYKGRLKITYHNNRDGYTQHVYIDGLDTHKYFKQVDCICGLYLIYNCIEEKV